MNENKKELELVFKKIAKAVDPVIKKFLISFVDKKFQKIIKYPVSAGGKRLRPALAAISCLLLGGKLKDVIEPASGLEVLHNYTLIVDDIIDNSTLRRGKPTCWAQFGNSIAQCIGIDYAATIFQTVANSKKTVLLSEIFSKAIKTLVEGEILDILFEKAGREEEAYVVKNRYRRITEKDYFQMAGKKTAALFAASCQAGGICANGKEKDIKALRKYGLNLGIAFQITDDILDIFGKEKKFNKKIGKDIEDKKEGNIVILLALKKLKNPGKDRFLKIIRRKNISEKGVKKAIKIIEIANSREKAYQLGASYIRKAKNALKDLPQNKWRVILSKIADFTLIREK